MGGRAWEGVLVQMKLVEQGQGWKKDSPSAFFFLKVLFSVFPFEKIYCFFQIIRECVCMCVCVPSARVH